jgi:hypothetical protein
MTTPAEVAVPVTFRLVPMAIGIMWSGVVLGAVLILGPIVIPGEGAEIAIVGGGIFAVCFGLCAMLSHRSHVTYDPETRTLTTVGIRRRTADLTRPIELAVAGHVGHGYHLHTQDAGRIGLGTSLVSAEGYDVHDLAAELFETAPNLEVTPELAVALREHIRTARTLDQRPGSVAARYALQLCLAIIALVAGPQVFWHLFGG